MAAEEEILKLFDTCWFEQEIFKSLEIQISANVTTKEVQENTHEIQESANILMGRSQSDYCLSLDNTSFSPLGNSPTSVIITHNRVQEPIKVSDKKRRRIKREVKEIIRIRRSSSDLELEELKGFMDLGFEFSEEDKNSRLVTIVPGLEKWGKRAEEIIENSKKRDVNSRPYLSEVWEILEKRKMTKKLLKWRVPAMNNEINMKDNLRVWAQTVASTFR
ncbi:uncharacterized protein [Nicotiana sylvestris]|uniref:Uncharacterized protein LOC104241317 n=1 Tax=Nicotiana sylvestris TaxID=4096 RepID=A0A1U7XR67_NICSY|nr:PREDICTED: uncharacterized protein LOC104241317 [Nicotiana sylvestris]